MADTRMYVVGEMPLDAIGTALEQYLSSTRSLSTQRIDDENRVILQCTDTGTQWKKFLGMDTALTIDMTVSGNVLTVAIGNAKWIDKAGAAAVGAVLFAPLLITAGIGALIQGTLPDDIFRFMETRLHLVRSTSYTRAQQAGAICPGCGFVTKQGDMFCSKCGTKL